MKIEDIVLDKKGTKKAIAYEMELGQKKLIIIKCQKGYIACGYIDKNIAEKNRDVAGFVTGIKSIDEMLSAKIENITKTGEKNRTLYRTKSF